MSDSADVPNSSSFVGWSITLLISLLLHGIFLVLPMPSGSQAEESEEPEEQEETVKVTKLPSVAPPPLQPPSRKLPPRPKVERQVIVQPPPQAVQPPAPRPQLTPEPPKGPEPSPSTPPDAKKTEPPEPSPEPTPIGGASDDPQPQGPTEAELQAMRQQALDQLYDTANEIEGAQAFKAAIIDPSTLDQPQAFFTEDSIAGDAGPELRPHLREPKFFDNKEETEVQQLVQSSPEWSNLEPLGNYGGGPLFKATRSVDDQTDESVTYYLNIVSNNSTPTSTYLFFWDKNPNEA